VRPAAGVRAAVVGAQADLLEALLIGPNSGPQMVAWSTLSDIGSAS